MDRASIVFPIRFATGDVAVQTTTRELSERGVLVRCLEPPEAGTAISMKLYLPGSREPLQIEGVVREHSRNGEDPGFWADFVGVKDFQRARLGEVLERRKRAADAVPIGAMVLHPHEDPRRAFPRYKSRFAVRFASVQDFVLEYAANISAGGVFVHTESPPPLRAWCRWRWNCPAAARRFPRAAWWCTG